MTQTSTNLPPGYSIKELDPQTFHKLWKENSPRFFDDSQIIFRPYSILNESEQVKAQALQERMEEVYKLRLGLYHNEQFVGWCWGFQESAETFYMCNSAVFPEHRRKGLYTALLKETIHRVRDLGFQKIYSRHTATNNAVIIPKLKAGFNITNLELCDKFGVLVHLTHLPNPIRKEILEFRSGDKKPSRRVSQLLGLDTETKD